MSKLGPWASLGWPPRVNTGGRDVGRSHPEKREGDLGRGGQTGHRSEMP